MEDTNPTLKVRRPLMTLSLLDVSADQFEFPPLQPVSQNLSPEQSTSDDPIIREGSPIDFEVCDSTFVPPKTRVLLEPAQSSASMKDNLTPPRKRSMTKRHNLTLQQTPGKPTWMNWLQWAMNDSSIFADQEEEFQAALIGSNTFFQGVRDNSFFQWGLRYVPDPSHDNVYRTVVINELPSAATLSQILPRIRGGPIYSASLLNTWAITGCPTAMVTFVHQKGAMNFLRRVAQEGFYIGFTAVEVRPVPTPTYLMSTATETEVTKIGRTRCLVVCSRRQKHLKKDIYEVLKESRCRDYVECFGERDLADEVTIRFHSIKMAAVACGILVNHEKLKGVWVKTAPDPCSLV
ncbi:hypothetical protein N7462_008302 [Penicillium macrosclerotiorum]|uniref:uncharacterized protein n=1 Tax=Penicillium macrosclerotiorum TaxID=303699 RepID=UPI002548076E|nr:uncharacterized protein N7462_008302 [Penicillium macrosclerotiorum]KAJ5675405.1 hypothetical protein N7462_008302 [Penicillium macrosclerotiorum]